MSLHSNPEFIARLRSVHAFLDLKTTNEKDVSVYKIMNEYFKTAAHGYTILRKLEHAGLVETWRKRGNPRCLEVQYTEKGEQVRKVLKKLLPLYEASVR